MRPCTIYAASIFVFLLLVKVVAFGQDGDSAMVGSASGFSFDAILENDNDTTAYLETKKLLQEIRSGGDFSEIIKSHIRASSIFEDRKKYEYSRLILLELLNQSMKNENDTGVYKASFELARIERRLINLETAAQYALSILSYSDSLNIPDKKADLLFLMADIYFYKKLFIKSKEYNDSARVLYIQRKDSIGLFKVENHYGLLEHIQGNPKNAQKYFQKASVIAEATDNQKGIASSYGNIAMTSFEMGKYDEYLESMKKCLDIHIELNSQENIATGYNNMGYYYYNVKNYPLAIDYLQKSIALSKKINFKTRLAQSYDNLALVYKALQDYKKAYEYNILATTLENELNEFQSKRLLADMTQKYELVKLDLDFAKIKKDNELKNLEINKANAQKRIQGIIIWFLAIVFFLGMLVVVFMYRLYDQKKQINEQLIQAKKSIEIQAAELKEVNLEITRKNQKLSESLNALKNTQNQLIQSEKMASLGVLMSGIAHEINNPFNFIIGGIHGLKKYLKSSKVTLNEQADSLLNAINVGVDRAAHILKSMNDFSRDSKSPEEHCDVHEIIDNCLLILNNQIIDHIKIDKKYTSEEFRITGNLGKLHQVFMNILMNSIHAIEKKGKINITTELKDGLIEIKIQDNGHGISDDDLSQITDPFFTTKEPGEGTGLGLSIAYSIIQEHHGQLEFESKVEKGTEVTIRLPIY